MKMPLPKQVVMKVKKNEQNKKVVASSSIT
jgi:hypothetical protein